MSDDLAAEWRQGRLDLIQNLVPAKNAQEVTITLSRTFASLTTDQRVELEPLLREWLRSDDESDRFDAIAIVRDNDVTSMIPDLRELQDRLEDSTEVGAPYEWAKVNRVLGHLVSVATAASDLTSESES